MCSEVPNTELILNNESKTKTILSLNKRILTITLYFVFA